MEFFDFIKALLSVSSIGTHITKETPVCPNCQTEMESQEVSSSSFHRCATCSGLWLAEEVFGTLLSAPLTEVESLLGEATPEHTFERSPQSRVCPSCENTMDNYQFNYDSGIWLDACPGNHGIWLDQGELKLCRACKEEVDSQLATGGPSADTLLQEASTTLGDAEQVRNQLQEAKEPKGPCLIVGAGPVGLTMALLLRGYGVDFRIIEKDQSPQIQTKAAGLWSRSLEVFEHLGLAELFLENSHLATSGNVFADGRKVLEFDLTKISSHYNHLTLIPQHRTESLLSEALEERGITVERGVQLASWDGVRAELKSDDGETESLRPRFLFGCDGARSSVRKECGLDFEGQTLDGSWLVGDILAVGPELVEEQVNVFLSPNGPIAFFPLGTGRYRVVAAANSEYARGDKPGLPDFEKIAQERVPGGLTLNDGQHLTVFTIHERQVPSYRKGVAFLLGDAAHIHSPAGGQGLNTGIQDAFNLAWKVAHVVNFSSPDSLLDTYTAERHPVAARVLTGSRMATKMTFLQNPIARAARDAAMTVAGHLEPVLSKIRATLSETDIHYRDSTLSGKRAGGRLKPGDRVPDLRWTDESGHERRIQNDFRGSQWKLLNFAQDNPGWDPAKIDLLELSLGGELDDACGVEGGRLLVRPDGYLAASFRAGDDEGIQEYLRSHVGYSGLKSAD